MITKEEWFTYSPDKKLSEIQSRLAILIDIDKGLHPLYNKKEQGNLCVIKKELTQYILTTIQWEDDKI